MSILGTKFLWWLDPFGGLSIGLLILFSWVSTAFDHVWLLVGKGAPKEFVNKCIYMTMVHDDRIRKVDTVSSIGYLVAGKMANRATVSGISCRPALLCRGRHYNGRGDAIEDLA